MALRLVWQERDVWAAEDDGLALRAKMIGEFVGPHRTSGDDRHADEIRIEVEGFKPVEPLETGLQTVRQAFAASTALITFYRAHRQQLDQAAQAAVPV